MATESLVLKNCQTLQSFFQVLLGRLFHPDDRAVIITDILVSLLEEQA